MKSGKIDAPDFALQTVYGDKLKLSDLQGKYVLIDFWASWCGPCRRENPNLVRLFEKFRKKDFTILSVSLDNNIDAWKKAIEKDGLIWKNHVSDLLGWESPLTKIYKFNQIPHTVLVNKEGKIIAKNLRGKQLENKLLEILNNMKTVFLSALLLFSFLSFSQSVNISIQGKIVNSNFKEAWLLKDGEMTVLHFKKTSRLMMMVLFLLKQKIPSEDYYTLAFPGDASIELVLRKDSDIKIYGDGSNITKFCNIVNSEESQQMLFFKRELNKWRKTLDSAEKIVKTDPSRKQELTEAISPKFYSFKQYQQNYVAQNQNSAALLPLLELFPMETQMKLMKY